MHGAAHRCLPGHPRTAAGRRRAGRVPGRAADQPRPSAARRARRAASGGPARPRHADDRRRGLHPATGGPVGAGPAHGERLRAHRGHLRGHLRRAGPGRRRLRAVHRPGHGRRPRPRPRRLAAPHPAGRAGRAVHRRARGGAWLPQPPGTDRGPVRRRPVRAPGDAHVPHRRPGAPDA